MYVVGGFPLGQVACLRRLILFLQQSSVEWASSLWMHVVQELDPDFKRTVRLSLCSQDPINLRRFLHAAAPSWQ